MDTWLVILILGNLGFWGLMIGLAVYYRLQRDRQRSEERMRMLDRFTSAEELEAFLASASGRHLLDRFAPPPPDPRRAILLAVGCSVLLLAIGGGILLFTARTGNVGELAVGGTVLLGAGVGLLGAGALSSVLVRRWALVDDGDDVDDDRRPRHD